METATFIKGEAFEQLVGVFLAYKYPNEKIIPQYCLIVDPKKDYYGLRADYKVGNDIYEIKWGRATEAIDECTEKQKPHVLAKGFNYKLLSCVLNEDTKETFTPFMEEVEKELKNKDCIQIFSTLISELKRLSEENNALILKKYRDAFFSIYVNAMDKNNDRKEYIEEIMLAIATTKNLDELIEANDLTESPASLDANFEYKGVLYQGKVLLSEHRKENKDKFKEEKIRKEKSKEVLSDISTNFYPSIEDYIENIEGVNMALRCMYNREIRREEKKEKRISIPYPIKSNIRSKACLASFEV